MYFWSGLPLFRLILPFILGILLSSSFYFEELVIINLALFLVLIVIHLKIRTYSLRWLFGVLASLFFFGLGLWINPNSLDFSDENYYAHFLEDENTLFLECLEEPQEKANSYKVIVQVYGVNEQYTSGKLLLYVDKNIKGLHYGSRLIVLSVPREINPPRNPYQFNYRNFLFHKSISHQLFISKEDVVILDELGGTVFNKQLIVFRQTLLQLLHSTKLSSEELGVASALLLGYKQIMDEATKQAFSNTGVVHILAVSGLHVGIIYLLLTLLLQFMERRNSLKILKLLIILVSLWAYAFLTALSPSVLRAATMFSFLAIGATIDRSTNIYNTLAASAFVLLIINPHLVYEVGFQLSYLAVLGIVSIYPKLYALLQFKVEFIDYFWQLFCVSLAAQLITFPLSIYYFHQFPNYFFIANLLVVPLVPLIIYSGMGFLLFHELAFLSEPFEFALQFLIQFLLKIVGFLGQLPNAVSDFLYLNSINVILLYAVMGALLLAVYLRKKVWLNVSLLMVLTFQLSYFSHKNKQMKRSELVFYSVNRHTAFGLISNGEGLFFMNEDLLSDTSKQSFNLYNHWSFLDLKNKKITALDSNLDHSLGWKKDCHLQLADSRILWINNNFKLLYSHSLIEIDYCLVSDYFPMNKLLQVYQPKRIILDTTLPNYMLKKLTEECLEMKIPLHDLNSKGALVVDFND